MASLWHFSNFKLQVNEERAQQAETEMKSSRNKTYLERKNPPNTSAQVEKKQGKEEEKKKSFSKDLVYNGEIFWKVPLKTKKTSVLVQKIKT